MEIKGVNIQKKENYYKILSVIRNNKDITAKEVKVLNSFLNGEETKQRSLNILSENRIKIQGDKRFSAIRALAHRKSYSFFETV